MKAWYKKYILDFKRPSGTSRGILTKKETWFIFIEDKGKTGIGECGLLKGLSMDDVAGYEQKLSWACNNINDGLNSLYSRLYDFPSIQFGLEIAFRSLESDSPFNLFPSDFTRGKMPIPINGLIWMGSREFMAMQIKEKIEAGFDCIKMKIGAIDFDTEYQLLKSLRQDFSAEMIEIRVDANGAFSVNEALEKLKRLSELELHSIEQPIRQNQIEAMASLCEESPLPIALDEELIGISHIKDKDKLLQTIKPDYIILKPSLIGGFRSTLEWISTAENQGVGWWITSALESNVGLNAISQWTFLRDSNMHQGLGTGGLFTNNFESPLVVKNGTLRYQPKIEWEFNLHYT
ncbi:MAG: o-succinylbenzoate synthase [Bacteroidia bacterium]|nr:o-succinylbenzoate synthase [Bacteroidia bacterium]NNF83223.1 o-succinylbenzoate synthase [Flavobacteriaceae bacterium]NNK70592.1 o-succinylbenzoate synthase [Flavobacteriaceae bacterium]